MNSLVPRIIAIAIELVLVAVCTYLSLELANAINFIPRNVLFVPHQIIATELYPLIIKAFVVGFGLLFLLSTLFTPVNPVSTAESFISRLFSGALTLTLLAIWVYLFSGAPFNPGVFMAYGAYGLIAYSVAYMIYGLLRKKPGARWLGNGIKTGFKAFIKPWGIATLFICLAPVALMYLYSTNRDVSDFVTRFRLSLIPEGNYSWGFENALGEQLLPQPIDFRFSPDDPNTLYVLSRVGQLFKVYRDASQPMEELLDISETIGYSDIELGALAFAFHPEFGNKGAENSAKIYLFYTTFEAPGGVTKHPGVLDGAKQSNRLASFDLSSATPEERRQTEVLLIDTDRLPSGSHNGGAIEFGVDGFMYVSIGESTMVDTRGQVDRGLFGGVFRIDVDKTGGDVSHPIRKQPLTGTSQEYFIPSDNPFVGIDGVLEEFWAYGLRNPFRFSFDTKTNDLWLGDVGTSIHEEVNLIEKGGNYQYPYREGFDDFGEKTDTPGHDVEPVFVYKHTALDRAIIGGVIYRDGPRVEWEGMYFFADNYSGKVSILNPDNIDLGARALARVPEAALRGISTIRTSPSGELLLSVLGHPTEPSGRILTLLPNHEIENAIDAPIAIAQTDETSDGATVYARNCASCHGADATGKGDTSAAVEVPDFTDPAYNASRPVEAMTNIIKKGGTAEGLSGAMPPWGEILTGPEIDAVIEYLRSLGGS